MLMHGAQELYEPLFESITANASQHGFRIRGFWIADPVGAGESACLNENELGNDRKLWKAGT